LNVMRKRYEVRVVGHKTHTHTPSGKEMTV